MYCSKFGSYLVRKLSKSFLKIRQDYLMGTKSDFSSVPTEIKSWSQRERKMHMKSNLTVISSFLASDSMMLQMIIFPYKRLI